MADQDIVVPVVVSPEQCTGCVFRYEKDEITSGRVCVTMFWKELQPEAETGACQIYMKGRMSDQAITLRLGGKEL